MAVDSPVLYNDYWVYLRFSMGSTHLNPNEKQIHNAEKIYNNLIGQGYTAQAACGILGNMQTESGLSPGALDAHLSSLPNNGEHLVDLTNNVMLNYSSQNNSGYGTGLIQWDGYTTTPPAGNIIASFAIRYNYEWYDGDCQLYRLQREYETDSIYHYWYSNNHSPSITWSQFKAFTGTPEEAADIFRQCRERSSGDPTGNQNRRDNARYWFNYFQGESGEWISGTEFSSLALAYDGQFLPYVDVDCLDFVNLVWHDITDVPSDVDLGRIGGRYGTNTLWRSSRTFPTTDPNGVYPALELWWKGTISQCESTFGELPAGCLLFHKISDAGPPPIPSYYAGDGIGNFAHVGIYCGNNTVMQSGGADAGSIPGGGVHRSAYDPSVWNYCAFCVFVDPTASPGPGPGPGPEPGEVNLLFMWYNNNIRRSIKNVRNIW